MDKASIIKALRDTAQSASNAIASNVSGPVDLLAAGLRMGGLNVNNPVGGSQWMQERGLTRDVEMGAPRIIGETLGMAGPAVVAAKAPQIASGINQAAANAMAPRTLNPQAGAIVWHGSPHKFDKFDSSKIGTGEGAQAYGHGLYLAESPDVAKSYLATGQAVKAQDRPTEMVARAIDAAGGDDVAAKAWLQKRLSTSLPEFRDIYESALSGFDKLKPQGSSLYKVDLPDEHIAKMLDWDSPLNRQSDAVKAALELLIPQIRKAAGTDESLGGYLGKGIYEMLGDGKASPQTAQMLRDAGIPGIRYLDGGSRGAGQGSSNFVVFPGNESMLKILERNGQTPGMLGIK